MEDLKKMDGLVFPGGGQPFFKNMDTETLNRFMKNIQDIEAGKQIPQNEIVYRKKTNYMRAISKVMKIAKDINDNVKPLPIWAVCLGFEAMILNDGAPHLRLNPFSDRNKHHAIEDIPHQSQETEGSFANFIKRNFVDNRDMNHDKFFFYYHIRGFTPKNFLSDPYLKGKYNVLAISDEEDFLGDRILAARPSEEDEIRQMLDQSIIKGREELEKSPSDLASVSFLPGTDNFSTHPVKEAIALENKLKNQMIEQENQKKLAIKAQKGERGRKLKSDSDDMLNESYDHYKAKMLKLKRESKFRKLHSKNPNWRDIFADSMSEDQKQMRESLNMTSYSHNSQEDRQRKLVIHRLMNFNSPFKVRKLYSNRDIKTDFRKTDSTFIAIVENKNYPFYGVQFHNEKPLYDFHKKSGHVHTDRETQWSNEILTLFFLEKVLSGSIKNLKYITGLDNDVVGFHNLLSNEEFKNKEERKLFYLIKLRDYIYRSCRINGREKGCRKFDYSMLDPLYSQYQKNMSEQMILNFDQFYRRSFLNEGLSEHEQVREAKNRFALREVSAFAEVFFFKFNRKHSRECKVATWAKDHHHHKHRLQNTHDSKKKKKHHHHHHHVTKRKLKTKTLSAEAKRRQDIMRQVRKQNSLMGYGGVRNRREVLRARQNVRNVKKRYQKRLM